MKQDERVLRKIKADLLDKMDPIEAAAEFKIYIELWKANVPLKYWNHEVQDIDHLTTQKTVQKYVNKMDKCIIEGYGLYFHGPQGAGKTLAASVILKEAIKKGYTAQFTMLTEILEKYCNTMYDEVGRKDFNEKILEADILVIDDIDKTHISQKSDFADAAYDYLFRARANKKLPILVTSNMPPNEFAQTNGMSFGKSLLSLFREHLYTVEVISKDRRSDIQKKLEEFFDG